MSIRTSLAITVDPVLWSLWCRPCCFHFLSRPCHSCDERGRGETKYAEEVPSCGAEEAAAGESHGQEDGQDVGVGGSEGGRHLHSRCREHRAPGGAQAGLWRPAAGRSEALANPPARCCSVVRSRQRYLSSAALLTMVCCWEVVPLAKLALLLVPGSTGLACWSRYSCRHSIAKRGC